MLVPGVYGGNGGHPRDGVGLFVYGEQLHDGRIGPVSDSDGVTHVEIIDLVETRATCGGGRSRPKGGRHSGDKAQRGVIGRNLQTAPTTVEARDLARRLQNHMIRSIEARQDLMGTCVDGITDLRRRSSRGAAGEIAGLERDRRCRRFSVHPHRQGWKARHISRRPQGNGAREAGTSRFRQPR